MRIYYKYCILRKYVYSGYSFSLSFTLFFLFALQIPLTVGAQKMVYNINSMMSGSFAYGNIAAVGIGHKDISNESIKGEGNYKSLIRLISIIEIKGRVTNDKAEPLEAASVSVKGSSKGVSTDANGNFTIQANIGDSLVISFVGHKTVKMVIKDHMPLHIILKQQIIESEQVVVVGYGSKRKKDLTGAVSVIDLESTRKQPVPDLTNMLQGQSAGVSVINSGQPGQAPVIQIRGFNSFGNNVPLYVVDGVPTQNISSINPSDIASMQVLKDAGAASIYGSRASNGVIIITTRMGVGKVKIVYDGYYGAQIPKTGNVWDKLNAAENGQLIYKAQENFNFLNPGNPIALGNQIYGTGPTPTVPDYLIASSGAANGGYAASDPKTNPALYNFNQDFTVSNRYQISKANTSGTDWFHELFKPAVIQQHNLAISGGNDQGNYLFSLNYFNQQGTLLNTYYKRFTIRSNSQFKLTKHIKMGENLTASLINNPQSAILAEGSAIAMGFRMSPLVPVYDIQGNFSGTAANGLGNPKNPVAIRRLTSNDKGRASRLFGNVFAELELLNSITLRTVFGGEYYTGFGNTFTRPDPFNSEAGTATTYSEYANNGYNWTWTNTATYKIKTADHDFNLLIGTEANDVLNHNVGGTTSGYSIYDPNYINLSTGFGTQTNYSNSNPAINNTGSLGSGISLVSYFARADYIYKERFLLAATIRRDGSSKFLNNRWGNFPSFSAGWRIAKEQFMQNIIWIQDLKIRGSWGIMGNQFNALGTNSFNLYGSNKQTTYYDISGTGSALQFGASRLQFGNPDAKWEKDINTNIGMDVDLFAGKLSVSADWYYKKINDLLFQITLPGTNGTATVPAYNVAAMENSGIDISINGQANISRDLKLRGTLAFTTVNNRILAVNALGSKYFDIDSRRFNGSYIIRNAVDHPVSSFYGYKIIGFWKSQAEIDAANADAVIATGNPNAVYQTGAGIGRFRYADTKRQGHITPDSKQFLGNPSPKFTYGINLGAEYKNFDCSIFLYGIYGNDIWNNVRWWTDFYSNFPGGGKSNTALYKSWAIKGDNSKATAPIQDASNGSNFSTSTVPNSYFVEKGSYLRAKNMVLGYTFPLATLKKYGISRLRTYLQAANLFTITKYSGADPELSVNAGQNSATDFGIDEGSYPNTKQFLFGLQVSF